MSKDCNDIFNCCDCGTEDNGCGCSGCWSCNHCESCAEYYESDHNKPKPNCENIKWNE